MPTSDTLPETTTQAATGLKTTVIYHRADFDGIASGLIVALWLEKLKLVTPDSLTCIGWDYGDPVPDVTGCESLWMVDINVPDLMHHPRLTWIDHHKTAIDRYGDRMGYQLDGVAACRLAWHFMRLMWEKAIFAGNYPTKQEFVDRSLPEPLLVRLLGEYDVWDKRDPKAELLQLGLRSFEDDADALRTLLMGYIGDFCDKGVEPALNEYCDSVVHDVVENGKIVQAYSKRQNAAFISRGHDLTWKGLTFLTLNHAMGNSLTFEAGVRPHHDALLMWRYDGKIVKVSLYGAPHRPDLDLSEIAKEMGGGGHRQSCGFECSLVLWSEILRLQPS